MKKNLIGGILLVLVTATVCCIVPVAADIYIEFFVGEAVMRDAFRSPMPSLISYTVALSPFRTATPYCSFVPMVPTFFATPLAIILFDNDTEYDAGT